MQIDTGELAPEFAAPSSSGSDISLSQFRGQWVILYLYPKNDTPGCTKEACGFRDAHGKISGLNAVVIGCSPDDLKSHDRFVTKYDLPFLLVSDPDHAIAQAYGAWKEKNMYGRKIMGIERSTFLINPEGLIVRTWRRVRVEGHVDEIIDEIKMNS